MINFRNLSIIELQNCGISGDKEAILELGRRVLNMPIHNHAHDDELYCRYKFELEDLESALDVEIPIDCPHCGKWFTDL